MSGHVKRDRELLPIVYKKLYIKNKPPGQFHEVTKPHYFFGKTAFCEKCLVEY